jgi:hypothetical protein
MGASPVVAHTPTAPFASTEAGRAIAFPRYVEQADLPRAIDNLTNCYLVQACKFDSRFDQLSLVYFAGSVDGRAVHT